MPGQERIDEIFDNPAIIKQVNAVNEALNTVIDTLKRVQDLGKQVGLGKSLTDSQLALQEARAEIVKLKKDREELLNQEKRLKNAALEAAAQQRAATQAQIDAAKKAQEALKTAKEANNTAAQAAINHSKQQEAAAKAALAQTKAQTAANNANKKSIVNAAGSLDDMRANLKLLTKQYDALGASARNAQSGMDMRDQIKKLRDDIFELEQATGRSQRNVGNYPQQVAQEAAGGIESALGLLGVSASAAAIFQSNYEVSDQLGDLQRIMGLTTSEADKLADSLKKLDTRTSLSGLLNIAAIAAKAGVAKEDIAGVTKAIDQLVVVLGSELGDADQVTESLVKLVNIFSKDGRVTGDALTSIGNAILGLANAGVASGPFLVDYAQRLAGIAKTANFALSAALGLGAGFEELGQSAEVAGTATQTILSKIATDVPKFAKLTGNSIEEFTKILREKPAEAIIQVSEALVKGKKGFDDIASAAADVEAKGRVSAVLGTIGANADKFRDKIKLAADALKDTSTIAEQFEIKNNTLAASVDKLKNAFINLTTDPNSAVAAFFRSIIDGANNTITAIDKLAYKIKTGISGFDANDLSNENISKLANGNSYARFKEVFDAAIAQRKSDQDIFITQFGQKTKEEQQAELKDLKEALAGASKDYERSVREYGTRSSVSIGNALGIQALSYRLKKSTDVFNGVGQKDIDTSVSDKEETEKERKKREAKERREREAAAKAREREIQAQADADKFDLNTQIEAQQEILKSEDASLAERLAANDEYYDLKDQLAEKDIAYQKEKVKQEIGIGKATDIELATLDKKLEYEKAKNRREVSKNTYDILNQYADANTKKVLAENSKAKQALEEAQNGELKQIQDYYNRGLISKTQYEDEKLRITNKYDLLELQADLEVQEYILDIMKQRGMAVEDQEAKIFEIRNKIRATDLKYHEDAEKNKTELEKTEAAKREELRKKEIEGIKNLAGEAVNAMSTLFSAYYDQQKEAVEKQISDLEASTQTQIEAVNASTASEEEKARKVALINARAAVQKQALANKEKQIEIAQARFDKAKSIASIIQNTAIAVTKVIPNPILMALAAAAGAVQLATVLATPLPQYKFGTDFHPGGAMMVNDGGKLEVIRTPDGRVGVAQGWNAIVDAPRGTEVFPSIPDFIKENGHSLLKELSLPTPEPAHGGMSIKLDQSAIEQALSKGRVDIKVINTFGGLQASMKRGASYTEFVNREIHFGA